MVSCAHTHASRESESRRHVVACTAAHALLVTAMLLALALFSPASAAAAVRQPIVLGAAREGATLWVKRPHIRPAYSYRWLRCNTAGRRCVAIRRATRTHYVTKQADVGRRLRARVTYWASGQLSTRTSWATARVLAKAPMLVTVPTISGNPFSGQLLTASTGVWSSTWPVLYDYAWRRCDGSGVACVSISGATGATYTPSTADLASTLRVVLTARSDPAGTTTGTTASATSAATVAIAAPVNPSNSALPVISGTAREDVVLSASAGTWNGSPTIGYAYQWQECDAALLACTDIGVSGSGAGYTVPLSMVGKRLRVVVTATNFTAVQVVATSVATSMVAGGIPVNSVLPALTPTGTPVEGATTLTVSNGTWSYAPDAYARQWQRCNASGSSCSAIPGATATTYQVTTADLGLRVMAGVIATHLGASSAPVLSVLTPAVVGTAPALSTPPAISGIERFGSTLVATPGTWAGTQPITNSYRWQRCTPLNVCTTITGATSPTYTLIGADVGMRMKLLVTAANAQASVDTAPVYSGFIADGAPTNTSLPAISGRPFPGELLTAAAGTWAGVTPITFTYQWQRCGASGASCTPIVGAAALSYMLTLVDQFSTIRITETATNFTNTTHSTSADSTPTAVVDLAAAPSNTAPPTVTGTPAVGQLLTADDGTWSGSAPITLTRQWERCDSSGTNCNPISGQSGATYAIVTADAGSMLRIVMTASNAGGTATASSAVVGPVTASPPTNTGLPSISGSPSDGATLSVDTGTWTGTLPITLGYQWQRCDVAGGSCVDIGGETAATYVAISADVGSTLRAEIGASGPGGSTIATTNATSPIAATPPVNTALPAIVGAPVDGQLLTAGAGAWTGTAPITFAYQWQLCDTGGSACNPIGGAIATTYTPTPADSGCQCYTLRVQVAASNSVSSTLITSAQTGVIQPSGGAPANASLPVISGSTQEGSTLTATQGMWANAPVSYAYQWRRCDASGSACSNLAGATTATFALTSGHVGFTIRVAVTATNAFGSTAATSAQTAVVNAVAPPTSTGLPIVMGSAAQGNTLTTSNGSWTGAPTSYAYQWRRCDASGGACVDIGGATASTYLLAAVDVGSTIRSVVTATNGGGSASGTSPQTAVVTSVSAPANSSLPTLSGTANQGSMLTGAGGTWSGTPTITYAYQWLQCDAAGANCTNIVGEIALTYFVQVADVGIRLRFEVTATNGQGNATAVSAPTAIVTGPVAPSNTVLPTITGVAEETATLTATSGTWTGTPTITTAFQWRRCDAGGGSCADIVGETLAAYQLQALDIGGTVRVRETASNGVGSTPADTDPTAVIAAVQAPVNTGLPTISGVPDETATLTATPGTWTGTPPIGTALQWLLCDAGGGACIDIVGATAVTYVVRPGDGGSTIRVRETATNAGAPPGVAESDPTTVVTAPNAPANTALPAIGGTTTVGSTLTASNGTWTGTTPITYARQWKACTDGIDAGTCSDIFGATGVTYVLDIADEAQYVRVEVTATNVVGPVAALSTAVGAITADAPANTGLPTISGTPTSTQVLTAAVGTWTSVGGVTYEYQWLECDSAGGNCTNLVGQISSMLALTDGEIGSRIRVRVRASNSYGYTDAQSAATATVTGAPPQNTVLPPISGTARDGSLLTASTGTWTGSAPMSFGYQWRRCNTSGDACADLAGATASTLTLTSSEVGTTVRVVVTAIGPAGSTSATSNATGTVVATPPTNTVPPTVPASPTQGQVATGTSGTWSGTAPMSFGYQWRRCNTSGTGCIDLAGATTINYTPVLADVGNTLRIAVTAFNAGGNASRTSNPSGAVAPSGAPVNISLPSIAGTPEQTLDLTAYEGTWQGADPIGYAYQWRRCDSGGASCIDVGSGTQLYSLTLADVGATLRVRVTATNAIGNDTIDSDPTAVVGAATAPANIVPPAVSGVSEVSQVLSADPGMWSGTQPIANDYQWQRCSPGCVDVGGATSSSYALAAADVGATLRVEVTASNTVGATVGYSFQSATVVAATAPVNTAPPAISGDAEQTQQLAVDSGSWNGTQPFTFSFQWRRCNNVGGACADIPGAVDPSYTLASADVGGTLRVVVTAANFASPGGVASPPSTQSAIVVASTPPSNSAPPTVGGDAEATQQLSASDGIWAGTQPIAFSYQWQRCNAAGGSCVDVAGATDTWHVLGTPDVGNRLRVVVTGTNSAGGPVSATSPASPVVIAATAPVVATAPDVFGTAEASQQLTTDGGYWTGTQPIAYAYQWQRCNAVGASCADVVGETGGAYILGVADVSSTLRVVVTADNAIGAASATSAASAVVVAASAPANTATPIVSGSFEQGNVVGGDTGSWSGTQPIGYSYQWRRCNPSGAACTDIVGEIGGSHVLTAADSGSTLRIDVTATNAAGSASATSAASPVVAAATAPVNTMQPTIWGTTEQGQWLVIDPGTWGGTQPISFAFQWRRCNAAGASCVNVGVGNATYQLDIADVGGTIRVEVTATNGAGLATASTAATGIVVAPTAPANTSPPTVSGTAEESLQLQADTGTWTGSDPISYELQWERCDATGGACVDIAGEVGSSYTAGGAGVDVGNTLRVKVRATNLAGSTGWLQSAQSAIVVAATPPVNMALPMITGTAEATQPLYADAGTWTGTQPIDFTFQWRQCDAAGNGCSDLPGATDSYITLATAQVGDTLRVVVTATNVTTANVPATSAQSAVVVAATPPANTGLPVLSGPELDGSTLGTTDGTWTGTQPITYAYQWQRCDDAGGVTCSNVSGDTNSNYALTTADVGKWMRAQVTASNAQGTVGPFNSNISGQIQAAPPVNFVPSTVIGQPNEGLTLSADSGTWGGTAPITYTFQWQRCDASGLACIDIGGATANTYVPGVLDVGGTLRVLVTADNVVPGTEQSLSGPTDLVVAASPANTVLPAISGLAEVGQVLNASDGTWTGNPPMMFGYQWARCDGAGAACGDVAGETGASYTLTATDLDSTLRVRVTANNPAGSASVTSSPTAVVVVAGSPVNTAPPAINGNPTVGSQLDVAPGTWTNANTIDYQWLRCDATGANCTDMPGEVTTSYVLTGLDLAATLRVRETGGNAVGSGSVTSAQTAAVTNQLAPVNTVPPAISGAAVVGKLLTVDPGQWDGNPTFKYQWQTCDAAGANCTDIVGEVQPTYTVAGLDLGGTLVAVVTATNGMGSDTAPSAASDVVTSPAPPSNVVAPAVSGDPTVGAMLSAGIGSWTGTDPISYEYQWRLCDAAGGACADIPGETNLWYVIAGGDLGGTLRIDVRATNVAGSASATSAPSGVVTTAMAPSMTSPPTVVGNAEVNSVLIGDPGTWTGTNPIVFEYQWYRCDAAGANCAQIAGETWNQHVVTAGDIGSTLRVGVLASNGAGTAPLELSAQTSVVASQAPPVNTVLPTITGTEQDGGELTASEGTWDGTQPMWPYYQWLRCDNLGDNCMPLPGETFQMFWLGPADVGSTIRVEVTEENDAGQSPSATSLQTGVIAP